MYPGLMELTCGRDSKNNHGYEYKVTPSVRGRESAELSRRGQGHFPKGSVTLKMNSEGHIGSKIS